MKHIKTLLFIVAALVTLLLIIIGPSAQKKQEAKRLSGVTTIAPSDHIYGAADAPVTIIEYSDIECPFCKRTHPILKQVVDNSGNKVNWVYRHFPLTSIHPQAFPLAITTECVARAKGNNAFWKVLDSLMADGNEAKALAQVGLTKAMIAECSNDPAIAEIITKSTKQVVDMEVSGTPYLVITGPNGVEQLPGMPNKQQLEDIISELSGQ